MRSGAFPREVVLLAAALAALALGVLVYAGERTPGSAWLMPSVEALHGRHFFGAAATWLPSAVHAGAFGLISAALLPPRTALYALACAGWVVVDLAFEFGQHPAVASGVSAALESTLPAALAQPLARYFLQGTFDPADVGAVLLGGAAAWGLLCWTDSRAEALHGQ